MELSWGFQFVMDMGEAADATSTFSAPWVSVPLDELTHCLEKLSCEDTHLSICGLNESGLLWIYGRHWQWSLYIGMTDIGGHPWILFRSTCTGITISHA